MTDHGLSLSQLRGLTERLIIIAKRNTDGELAELVAQLVHLCGNLTQLETLDREFFTLSPNDFAKQHDMSIRTVQWMCMKKKLPAIKMNGRWRIRDVGCEGKDLLAR